MKTNLTKAVLPGATVFALVAAIVTHVAASYADLMAMGVGYTAVAILVALALVDYRVSAKDYARR
ncbi:MAG TPA: hypothetical protein VL200_03990 [Lacunisphaera sp.]|jgi:hypothetical protein|nr:hypothetical protein [Lacunisphaera sp.]